MPFQPIFCEGDLLLPKLELNMISNQTLGITTDLKRKQLSNELVSESFPICHFRIA